MPTYAALWIDRPLKIQRTIRLDRPLEAYLKEGAWAPHPDPEVDDTVFRDELLAKEINMENYDVEPDDLFESERTDLAANRRMLLVNPYEETISEVFAPESSLVWATLVGATRLETRQIAPGVGLTIGADAWGDEATCWWQLGEPVKDRYPSEEAWQLACERQYVPGKALIMMMGMEGEVVSLPPDITAEKGFRIVWRPDVEFDYIEVEEKLMDTKQGPLPFLVQRMCFKPRGAPSRKPETEK